MELQLSVLLSHGINNNLSIFNKSSKSNDKLFRYSTLKFTHPHNFQFDPIKKGHPYKLQILSGIGKSMTANSMKKVPFRYLEPFSQRSPYKGYPFFTPHV